MTPKERVITTLNFKTPDRVPMNFSCTPEFQEKLYKYFHIKNRKAIVTPLVSTVDPEILEKLKCDLRVVIPPHTGPPLKTEPDGTSINLFGVRRKPIIRDGITWYDYGSCPLKKAISTDIDTYPWPDPEWFNYTSIKDQCKEYKNYAIITGSPGNGDFLHLAGNLYGIEDMYIGLVRKDPLLLKIFQKISDFFYEYNRRILEAGKGMIDIIFYGDDYGGQKNSLISEKIYREILKPLWEKHYFLAKSYRLKIMHHSCGSIAGLLPVMYETGVDIIDPLQGNSRGMNPEELKKQYSGKIAFHGGINLQAIKSVSEIRREVRRILSIMVPGGGYIMAPTTIITEDVPLEYVIAMYEEVVKKV